VAATAATVSSKSFSVPVPPCAADRAFSFALLHQATGTPLFVGRVGDPTRVD
jgi:serpin B